MCPCNGLTNHSTDRSITMCNVMNRPVVACFPQTTRTTHLSGKRDVAGKKKKKRKSLDKIGGFIPPGSALVASENRDRPKRDLARAPYWLVFRLSFAAPLSIWIQVRWRFWPTSVPLRVWPGPRSVIYWLRKQRRCTNVSAANSLSFNRCRRSNCFT